MAENDDTTAGADDTVVDQAAPAPEPAPETASEPAVEAPTGFTSRVWSFRAMLAVALASLVIGGGIGSAIAAVSGDDEPEHRMRVTRFSDGPGGGPGEMPGERGRGNLGERLRGMPDGQLREFGQEFRQGLDPEELEELKGMREEMRQQMKEWREELQDLRDGANDDAPEVTPSPSAS